MLHWHFTPDKNVRKYSKALQATDTKSNAYLREENKAGEWAAASTFSTELRLMILELN